MTLPLPLPFCSLRQWTAAASFVTVVALLLVLLALFSCYLCCPIRLPRRYYVDERTGLTPSRLATSSQRPVRHFVPRAPDTRGGDSVGVGAHAPRARVGSSPHFSKPGIAHSTSPCPSPSLDLSCSCSLAPLLPLLPCSLAPLLPCSLAPCSLLFALKARCLSPMLEADALDDDFDAFLDVDEFDECVPTSNPLSPSTTWITFSAPH